MGTHKGTSGKKASDRGYGFDNAYYSGPVEDYKLADGAGYLHALHSAGTRTDGTSRSKPDPDGTEKRVPADAGPSPVTEPEVQDRSGPSASGADRGDSGTLELYSTLSNQAPTAKPDAVRAGENEAVLVDVLGNDYDPDEGAVLTVIAASAPFGQGDVSLVKNQVQFDPNTYFDSLVEGESVDVPIAYEITDEHGATGRSTLTVTVVGVNDAPVANPDWEMTSESSAVIVDVLANDYDPDSKAVLTLVAASGPRGQGKVAIVENRLLFDPGSDFDHLGDGESAAVILEYTIEDEYGARSSATLIVEVQGRGQIDPRPPTDEGELLIGTPDGDSIDALGGDDAVYGIAGDDLILGGDGNDFLSGGDDNDVIDGGAHDDMMAGDDGHDQLFGRDGNDSLFGDTGDDRLLGHAGDDGLDGGGGDDKLSGGEGDDSLADFAGINSLSGGIGHDRITAGSADGAQRIDGGDGDDSIRHYYRHHSSVIATGAGRDSIELLHADSGKSAIVVTDFKPGAEGDTFRLGGEEGSLLSLLSGWDGSSNPFGAGFLRLQQEGAHTLLLWDRDGQAKDWEWETLVIFENADAGAFTDANFLPAYHPDGSAPAGGKIVGTKEDDALAGTIGDDLIYALGGNDLVDGGPGADGISGDEGSDMLSGGADNDVVDGGDHDDALSGGDGDDRLFGQADNDHLSGETGNDELSGGKGNDSLEGGEGDDTLLGDDGDDFLSDFAGSNAFSGGTGQDHIFAGAVDGAQRIDGGDGDDTIRHYSRYNASEIATGGGRDSIELLYANLGKAAIVVTDFTPGADGDILRLAGDEGSLLSLLSGWDGGSNPFRSGFLRLQQEGSDTLLLWDRDGEGKDSDWETLIVFANSDARAFTDANFLPGYHPDGSVPLGRSIKGTDEGESLAGTFGDDTIDALGGDDVVSGLVGADVIDGGDGLDFLYGHSGGDSLRGGNDDDYLSGGEGGDQLAGDSGNDILFGEAGDDKMSGGEGDDSLDGGDGDDSLSGGGGGDFLSGGLGLNSLKGGLGNDTIVADSTDGAQWIDGGDGSDSIRLSYRSSASTITTGLGRDSIDLVRADIGRAAIVVTDFTPGAEGDMVRLSGEEGALLSLLSGWDGSSNPFATGFLRLQQEGAHTLLQWDRDGEAKDWDWETLIIFEYADAGKFTDANFLPGYHPGGFVARGQKIVGTGEGETLKGTLGGDSIYALGGDDVVFGRIGDDLVDGGDGLDFLYGDSGADLLEGGNGDDYLWAGNGGDHLSGDSGNDILFGENGDDSLAGGDGGDSLDGAQGDDTLAGGTGRDFLAGGAGFDVMTGGADGDIFDFEAASHGPDEITDFAGGSDRIRIWESGFGGGLVGGGPVSLVSGPSPAATQARGQFLYDTDDGSLYWDSDGTGSGAAVLVATFTSVPSLQASDFFVI
ncbi:MAG TPA: Ig-like domain-containing protein [Allosphingosinicella sp.]|nr:Ig-like domain-containing protein [Allosphingosinicella sp.]